MSFPHCMVQVLMFQDIKGLLLYINSRHWLLLSVADLRTFFTGFLLVDSHEFSLFFFPNHKRFSLIFSIFSKPNGFLGTHKRP
uniref:Uncharacterized protein n=1 Tax=Helianthus annuus TaxID=4232 RepID=A0A251S9H9_HELAN